jgi:hypothetical protein
MNNFSSVALTEKHFFGQAACAHGGDAVTSTAAPSDGISGFECCKRSSGVIKMPEVYNSWCCCVSATSSVKLCIHFSYSSWPILLPK